MAENEMIERVARAMCDRVNGQGDYDLNIIQRHPGWSAQARAAIGAMREPPLKVWNAGANEIVGPRAGQHVGPVAALAAWRAMIDAALSPAQITGRDS